MRIETGAAGSARSGKKDSADGRIRNTRINEWGCEKDPQLHRRGKSFRSFSELECQARLGTLQSPCKASHLVTRLRTAVSTTLALLRMKCATRNQRDSEARNSFVLASHFRRAGGRRFSGVECPMSIIDAVLASTTAKAVCAPGDFD